MAGKQFDSSDDPAFDIRVAAAPAVDAMGDGTIEDGGAAAAADVATVPSASPLISSVVASVAAGLVEGDQIDEHTKYEQAQRQEVAVGDVHEPVTEPVDDSSSHTTIGGAFELDHDDPAFETRSATTEQVGDDMGAAAEDALIAGMAAAPPVAAAEAVIDKGGDAIDLADDAAKAIGDLLGGGDEHPGQSTFETGPDDGKSISPEEHAEIDARANASANLSNRMYEAKHGDVEAGDAERQGTFGDFRQQDIADHDTHAQADNSLRLDPGIVGPGAAGGNAVDAPDGVMESVAETSPHVALGADVGGDAGAPDGVMESVAETSPHVALGADLGGDAGAPDGVMESVAETSPHVALGADLGGDAGAPDGVMESVAETSPQVAIGADPAIDVDQLPTADHAPAAVAFGDDVQLNPQPIPPGIGADIGEPVAAAAVDQAPSGDDSSIIIVGGTEAPLVADAAAPGFDAAQDVGIADSPMEQDIASTLAADTDGPVFSAVDVDEAPIDVGITEDEFDS